MLYRYETHCHANLCSKCAHSSPQELVQAYKAAGFAGLVLTDHFIHGYTSVDQSLPWPERMNQYYQAYLDAKAIGDQLDFDVIFGIEHAYGGGQEVLVYGIDLQFLLEHPQIETASLEEFSRLVHEYGGILIQAHPYRRPCTPAIACYLDAVEIQNCHPRQINRNELAVEYAKDHGLLGISGSDCHQKVDIGRGGILVETLPEDLFAAEELEAYAGRKLRLCENCRKQLKEEK